MFPNPSNCLGIKANDVKSSIDEISNESKESSMNKSHNPIRELWWCVAMLLKCWNFSIFSIRRLYFDWHLWNVKSSGNIAKRKENLTHGLRLFMTSQHNKNWNTVFNGNDNKCYIRLRPIIYITPTKTPKKKNTCHSNRYKKCVYSALQIDNK